LQEGEVFTNVTVVDEASKRSTTDYVARKNDVAIICIQTDPPDKTQLGVKLDIQTNRYIGLPADRESWAIVSEVNIDTFPGRLGSAQFTRNRQIAARVSEPDRRRQIEGGLGFARSRRHPRHQALPL
jgi:hypothetical protein